MLVSSAIAFDLPEPAHTFDEALVISNVRRAGRNPARTDAVEALLVRGEFESPEDGTTLTLPGGAARRCAQRA